MRSALRLLPLLVLTAVVGYKLGGSGEVEATATAEAASPALNACGCYRDSAGACYCGKKGGKCVCPGECEPQGCDEKRAKEIDKEVEAEAKRARDAEKKQEEQQAEQAEKDRKAALPPGDDDEGAPGSDKSEGADKNAGTDSASARKDDGDDDDGAKKKGLKNKAKAPKSKHGKNDATDKTEKSGGLEG